MDSDDDIPIASLGAKLHKPATPPKPPAPIPKISKPPQTASVATVSSSSILTASELARKKKLKAMKKFLKNQAAGGKRSRDDDDDDFEKSKKKASSSKPKGPPKPPAPPKKLKEQDKAERINQAMKAHLWWEAEPLPAGQQWRSMEHCGVAFPEEYEAHGVKMLYDGKEITLTKEGEEAANFFAAMDPNGMHLKNDATAKVRSQATRTRAKPDDDEHVYAGPLFTHVCAPRPTCLCSHMSVLRRSSSRTSSTTGRR